MALKRLEIPPGIVKSNTPYTQPGRYVDAQWVRFSGRLPQKRGGRSQVVTSTITGVCRGIHQWRDNSGYSRVGIGTNKKLYVFSNADLTDITPLRQRTTGTLSGPFTTTNGSTSVGVAHTSHNLSQYDWVVLTAASAVGGLTIAGVYNVATVVDADNYTITAASAATSNDSGGGTTSYAYYHVILGTDPIATTSGSSIVTISDTAHGAIEGDTAIISGASAVGGLTISGSYVVVSALTNSYTIDAGSNASSTATGGGSSVKAKYEINVGFADNSDLFGYGLGAYGSGTYGTARTSSIPISARTWSLWAYGEWLLANPSGGTLYKSDPSNQSNQRAVELYNSPSQMNAFFVTPERYIVALGTDGDDLKMRWPDQSDPTNWTAAEGNTANESRKVQGGSHLLTGRPARNGVNLIWTDGAAFLHQWRPDDYVFTTTKLGDNTGIFGPNAACVIGDKVYWIGDGAFWVYDGSVSKLPSDDIRDWFFSNLDRSQKPKVFMGSINSHDELIILYQETGQSEINRALIYNITDQVWTPCTVDETAWLDRVLFEYPIGIDSSGNILFEETGTDDYDGSAIDSYIEAGLADIESGDVNMDIMGFWPDIYNQAGDLSLYIRIRAENTQDAIDSQGPYTLSTSGDHVDLREAGKAIGFKLESNTTGGDWRLGVCRAEVQSAGAR